MTYTYIVVNFHTQLREIERERGRKLRNGKKASGLTFPPEVYRAMTIETSELPKFYAPSPLHAIK